LNNAGGDNSNTALLTEGEQIVEALLLEEGVPTGEHDQIHVRLADELGEHFGLVHTGADCGYDSFCTHLRERWIASLQHLSPVLIRVVEVGDVDALEAEALEAFGERTADPVTAEVEDPRCVAGTA
jgi:hypothetical protein